MQIIAVIACVAAAVLGVVSLLAHSSPLQSVVGLVADVWVLAWVIADKAYTREFWTFMNRPIRELAQYAPATTGVGRALTFGMIVLVAFDTMLWFV